MENFRVTIKKRIYFFILLAAVMVAGINCLRLSAGQMTDLTQQAAYWGQFLPLPSAML